VTTFDYWRREHRVKAEKVERRPRLMKVEMAAGRNLRAAISPQLLAVVALHYNRGFLHE
jgi:hypothetical protein